MRNVRMEPQLPRGTLVLIGGREDKDVQDESADFQENRMSILNNLVGLIRKKNPVLEVVTTSTQLHEESFEEYKAVFNKLGVKRVGKIHHDVRKDALDSSLGQRIREADAVFFTGGNQLLLTSIYGGTDFLTELTSRYLTDNIVIAGTSAGAMALSSTMIYAGNDARMKIAGKVKVTTGFQFLKNVCVDTHFMDRNRLARIAQVVATNPSCVGIGIDENTAIVVTGGHKAEVVGSGLITVVEGFEIEQTNIDEHDHDTPICMRNIRIHLLCRGHAYELPVNSPLQYAFL